MNTTSGIITLKISEWSKITRIHCVCIVHKTLTINDKIIIIIIIIIIINIQL
jgi:hypothetical protein